MREQPMVRWLVVALVALAASCTSANIAAETSKAKADPRDAVERLLGRVLPAHADNFELDLIAQGPKGLDAMQVDGRNGKVVLRGSSATALASALNWYLNDFCNVTYDWSTYAIPSSLPDRLPVPTVASPLRQRATKYTYYQNVCTMGYSLAFADWEYWEKHLDWQAMNGVNLPLAFAGQEYVWLEVFTKDYNLTFQDLQAFFSGPAFLPWFRMGNMQAWGGPITMHWVEQQYQLQLQILQRMRELGMTPVLSSFAGHIPPAMVQKYPKLNVSRSSDWNNFPDPYGSVYLLEATDPMFREIGSKFIARQWALFGTDHVYNCDTYNEMDPKSNNPQYLHASAAAVYAAMTDADPDAIWLMQGWLFFNSRQFWQPAQIQAYLGAVPDDRMWILDLYAENSPVWQRTNNFYGKGWIWCTLLNFGGQQGFSGNLEGIVDGIGSALSTGGNLLGVGITMEGIWQNYPVFEITLQRGWQLPANFSVSQWVRRYGSRRYGKWTAAGEQAWATLGDTVYSGVNGHFGSLITRRPRLWTNTKKGGLGESQHGKHVPITSQVLYHDRLVYGREECPFSGALPNTFLYDYPPGFDPHNMPYPNTLAGAEAWCQPRASCGGVTLSQGRYEARAQYQPTISPFGETSWVKLCAAPMGQAWEFLLAAKTDLADVPQYRFDLVDVTRQVLSDNFTALSAGFDAAVTAKSLANVTMYGSRILALIDDYDRLLSTDTNFMLGRWIQWARNWGGDDGERDWLEFNVRNQLTLWGPNGEINDYAAKSWGGLVRSYYKARWQLFVLRVTEAVQSGQTFDQNKFNAEVLKTVEQPWQTDTSPFPTSPEGDAVAISAELFRKYVATASAQ